MCKRVGCEQVAEFIMRNGLREGPSQVNQGAAGQSQHENENYTGGPMAGESRPDDCQSRRSCPEMPARHLEGDPVEQQNAD
jgi:hypothetical protein